MLRVIIMSPLNIDAFKSDINLSILICRVVEKVLFSFMNAARLHCRELAESIKVGYQWGIYSHDLPLKYCCACFIFSMLSYPCLLSDKFITGQHAREHPTILKLVFDLGGTWENFGSFFVLFFWHPLSMLELWVVIAREFCRGKSSGSDSWGFHQITLQEGLPKWKVCWEGGQYISQHFSLVWWWQMGFKNVGWC